MLQRRVSHRLNPPQIVQTLTEPLMGEWNAIDQIHSQVDPENVQTVSKVHPGSGWSCQLLGKVCSLLGNILDNIHDIVATVSTISFGGKSSFPRPPSSCASPQLSSLVFGYTNTCCFIIYFHINVE